ncbi:MAG TPA: DUF4133 domain-containing protein [Puia sp.]|nr:DUF4133 domain-containing protein [Puia sp.]
MATSAYIINKGVQRPIEFKGLRGQYILYAGALLVGDIVGFAVLYLLGMNSYLCLVIVAGLGSLGIRQIYRLSRRYGEFGWMKKRARKGIPRAIRSFSRKPFTTLNKKHGKDMGRTNAHSGN